MVAQGPRSGSAAFPAAWVLAEPHIRESDFLLATARATSSSTRPRRPMCAAVEKPQGWRASLALHIFPLAGWGEGERMNS